MPILAKKNHLFIWSSFWSWRVCQQAKLSHLGHRNQHAYIEKPTHPKRVTVWCGFSSRGIIRPFFFDNEQGEAVTVNDNRYRAMLNEFLFTKIEEKILTTFGFHRTTLRATLSKVHSMFCVLFSKIALSTTRLMSFGHLGAEILTPWDYYLWGAVKDKGCADKPETNEALKDIVREATGEIHRSCRLLHGQPRQPFE